MSLTVDHGSHRVPVRFAVNVWDGFGLWVPDPTNNGKQRMAWQLIVSQK